MSYLTQMVGLTVQNFFSAATGIAVAFALIRGFAIEVAPSSIGNFWVDLTRASRCTCCCRCRSCWPLFQMQQGTIQNFDAYRDATTLEVTAYDNPKLGPDGQPLKDDKGVAVTEPAKTQTAVDRRWARSPRRSRSR